jgi:integrase
MARNPYLYRPRPSGPYYARVRTPQQLKHIIGKSVVVRSLKTDDLTQAKKVLPAVVGEIQQEFERKQGRDFIASIVADLKRKHRNDEDDQNMWDEANAIADTLEEIHRKRLGGELSGKATLHGLAATLEATWEAEGKYKDPKVFQRMKRQLLSSVDDFCGFSGIYFLEDIKRRDLAEWVDERTLRKKQSAKTANNALAHISSLFKIGIRKGIVEANLAIGAGAKASKHEAEGTSPISNEALREILPAVKTETLYCCAAALLLGLRISEIRNIEPAPERGAILVLGTKNRSSAKMLPATTETLWLTQQVHKLMTPQTLRRVMDDFNETSHKLNLTKQTTHSLRKRYATELERLGAPPLTIVRLTRHATQALTFDRYAVSDLDTLRPWSEKLVKKLWPLLPKTLTTELTRKVRG